MSLTQKQRAYHLRKIRTAYMKKDINKSGYISREDYELMSKRLVDETSGMTEKKIDAIYKGFMHVADIAGLEQGVKTTIEDIAKSVSETLLSMTPEERETFFHSTYDSFFKILDTDKDGYISMDRFKVYLHVVAPCTTEAEITVSFDTIDANKDGKISREEFLAAAEDFQFGVEETEISKVFLGRLL